MADAKACVRQRVDDLATAEPALTNVLGVVVLQGMEEIASFERFSGGQCPLEYSTQFTMPDGQLWTLALSKVESPNAR